ncbi:SIS domain-containing protein [Aurantimonas sp. VKM B-3413]|uniref:SIS domain-containing protein n=1 Tax=Aurantimonas sp. VKM B-3413 TaxID=2779401 RepID=UPI001E4F3368|nr:aminotransferase [Aurantimonas sp. VKM B-3413]MCB8840412.1 aminotransferase [Aurantimonas sp. VKM B-3413]
MSEATASPRPGGLQAIEREMARQAVDARASFEAGREVAERIAASLRQTGRLLFLGMGGSHAVGRAVEPFYRERGIDAVAIPLSEQLISPLPTGRRTILVTSQSGESAEVLRWFREGGANAETFGLTLEGGSSLGKTLPCLVGTGGTELAFAATRSLTITFAQHLAILAALGADPAPALAALAGNTDVAVGEAVDAFAGVDTVVTSGRLLRGLAEAIALGFTELSREPSYALEGGQLRHGPMEMLGPRVGILQFAAQESSAGLVSGLSSACVEAGSPVVVLDASGEKAVPGAVTVSLEPTAGFAAIFRILPVAQRLMVAHAARRVRDVGTPRRSSKITRDE